MMITSKRNQDISSKARLISFAQAAGQVICVNFHYHIFGNSIGTNLHSGGRKHVHSLFCGVHVMTISYC